MMLAEEIKSMKSVDELLEINRRVPKCLSQYLPATLNGLYALAFAIKTKVTEESAVELLELINRFDEQTGAQFVALPMRGLQTMASKPSASC